MIAFLTAFTRLTRAALLAGAVAFGGLSLGFGCKSGDDNGQDPKERNRERFREPIRDRPMEGEEGARLVLPDRGGHA